MTTKAPVQPAYGTGAILAPAAGSVTATIAKGNRQVILTNQGANVCYVRIGTAGTAASTADYPIPPGAQVVVSKAVEDDKLSHISPLGTTLHVMTGDGF